MELIDLVKENLNEKDIQMLQGNTPSLTSDIKVASLNEFSSNFNKLTSRLNEEIKAINKAINTINNNKQSREQEEEKEKRYQNAIELFNSDSIGAALDIFKSLGNYKDSYTYVSKWKKKIAEIAEQKRKAEIAEQKRKEYLKILAVVGIIVAIFFIYSISKSIKEAGYSADKVNLSVVSKTNDYGCGYNQYCTIDLVLNIENKTSHTMYSIEGVLDIKDSYGTSLKTYATTSYVDSLTANSNTNIELTLNSGGVDELWNLDLSQLTISFKISRIKFDDGYKTYDDSKEIIINQATAQTSASNNDNSSAGGSTETKDNFSYFSTDEFNSYKNINNDYIGQIIFKSGIINEPVVFSETYGYYLQKNLKEEYSKLGTVYLDDRNTLDDQNLILYGKYTSKNFTDYEEYDPNVRPRFSNLELLLDEDNCIDNKEVYLYLEDEIRTYEVVAVYYCPLTLDEDGYYSYVEDGYEYYLTNYSSDEFNTYKNTIDNAMLYDTNLNYSYYDKFLTLQTSVEGRDDIIEIVLCKQTESSKIKNNTDVSRVIDDAGVLSELNIKNLNELINNYIEQTGYDIVVYYAYKSDYFEKYDDPSDAIFQLTYDTYDFNGYGTGTNRDGLIMCFDIYYGYADILYAGNCADVYHSDSIRDEISNNIKYYSANNDWYGAACEFVTSAALNQ